MKAEKNLFAAGSGLESSLIHCVDSKIIENKEIAPQYWILSLSAPEIAKTCYAGQFVMLRPEPQRDTLLARPFSIYRKAGGALNGPRETPEHGVLEFLYKIYGKGTSELSRLKPGEPVKLWGPLGQGFRKTNAKKWIFAAGGVGVAPFMILAEEAPRDVEIVLLFGVRHGGQAILKNEFESARCQVLYASEDGSVGKKGFVTDLLNEHLNEIKSPGDVEIFTCGPRIMEKKVAELALKKNISCQVAFEEYMGCGLGTCMGCVVKCHSGDEWVYKRVCREGPVFMADEIVWE